MHKEFGISIDFSDASPYQNHLRMGLIADDSAVTERPQKLFCPGRSPRGLVGNNFAKIQQNLVQLGCRQQDESFVRQRPKKGATPEDIGEPPFLFFYAKVFSGCWWSLS